MKSRLADYALLIFSPLFFSSNLLIGRASNSLVEPWTLAFGRWSLAALMLLPFAFAGIVASWERIRAAALDIFILGILGMVICGGIVYMSLHYTTATNATLIYTASSLMIVVMDAIYFGKTLTVTRAVGLVVGFLGVATIVLNGDIARLYTLQFNPGDLGILICSVSWAIYSVMLKRKRLKDLPTLPLFAAIASAGSICLIPFVAAEIAITGNYPATPLAWKSIVALAIIPGVLAYGTYQMCVKRVGPSITGVFMYLIPIYGVLLAVTFLGERFQTYHAVGLVLVIAGVVIATDPFNRNREPKT